MLRTLALTFALALPLLAGLPLPAPAQGTSTLAIDRAVKARGQRTLSVFEAPSRKAAPVRVDGGGELLVSGVISNVQGRWYEVVYPVRGWVREGDVVFIGPSGDYRPSQYPEEERIAMRLKSDVGVTPADWDSRLGRPWAEDAWTETIGGREMTVRTLVWPGCAVTLENAGSRPEHAVIVKAAVCGRSPVNFGAYALGESGEVFRRIERGFAAEPYARFASEHVRGALDEDGAIDFLSYSADGTGFLSCPSLGAPDPELPFYAASLYPKAWCGRRTLKVGLVAEGQYEGFGCGDEGCWAEVSLDSGVSRRLYAGKAEAEQAFGQVQGARVRAVYNIEQRWSSQRGACQQRLELVSGRVIAPQGSARPGKADCRPMTVGSGEARGVLARTGEAGTDGEAGTGWELVLDSDRVLTFQAGPRFPGDGVQLREGMRIAVQFERVLEWDDEAGVCAPATYVSQPARILGGG